ADVPGPPANVTDSTALRDALPIWTAPAGNGGSAITGYQVQVGTSAAGPYNNAAGCPTNSTATSCTATGLTNGTTYFFQVAAINADRTSRRSKSSREVTPAAVPGAP